MTPEKQYSETIFANQGEENDFTRLEPGELLVFSLGTRLYNRGIYARSTWQPL